MIIIVGNIVQCCPLHGTILFHPSNEFVKNSKYKIFEILEIQNFIIVNISFFPSLIFSPLPLFSLRFTYVIILCIGGIVN